MDLTSIALLVGGEGWGLLESLPPYDASGELALQTRLRSAGFSPEVVSAALTQSRLRARGRDKFGTFADGMLFTPDGLEQATRLEVAARHASRYLRAEVRAVHDLGCGIGADAMALAGLDLAVRAVDSDEVTAVAAGVNLRHWPEAQVVHGRAEDVALPRGEATRHTGLWLDPSRRVRGAADITGRTRRVFSLDAISPTWEQVQDYARAVPATGAKLSPAFPHQAVPPGAEAAWTSWNGEVVECALWWGPLVQSAGRTATVCRAGQPAVTLTEADAECSPDLLDGLDGLGSYVYEADRAVIRAGLSGALARAVDGAELDRGVGYVSSDRPLDVAWAHRYSIVEAMPWNVKALRAWLRDNDIGRLTIKKRGVALDPEAVRRQLRVKGSADLTLILTRVRSQPHVLLVRPEGPRPSVHHV